MSVFASGWMHERNNNIAFASLLCHAARQSKSHRTSVRFEIAASYPERTLGDSSQIECKKEKSEGKTLDFRFLFAYSRGR